MTTQQEDFLIEIGFTRLEVDSFLRERGFESVWAYKYMILLEREGKFYAVENGTPKEIAFQVGKDSHEEFEKAVDSIWSYDHESVNFCMTRMVIKGVNGPETRYSLLVHSTSSVTEKMKEKFDKLVDASLDNLFGALPDKEMVQIEKKFNQEILAR